MKTDETLSKKASMRQYLKANPDNVTKGDVTSSLENFLILQARSQANYKKCQTERVESTTSRRHRELHWWAGEEMDKNIGPIKAKSRRESGPLPSRPDSVTGKNEDPCKECGIPMDWEQITWADMKKLLTEYEVDADKDT
eukprot:9315974-Pyramimonas_sp.AAC.1